MQVRVITPPERLLTLAEVKAQCRIDHDDEDDLLLALIDTAAGHLGGPQGWLGMAIGAQVLEATDWGFGCLSTASALLLPYGPVEAPISVTYLDGDGAVQTLDSSSYELFQDDGLILTTGATLPTGLAWRADAVRIRYGAGSVVPAPVRQAMLLLIAHWYHTREAVNVGNIVTALPFSVEALLSPLRRYP